MHDVRILVGADDVDDCVRLPDVREELIAEALTLVGAGDQARDVVERDRVRDDLRGADRLSDRVEAAVRDGDDRDVRLNRRERVVGRLCGDPVSAVNSEDLPAFGMPTIPTFTATPPRSSSRAPLPRSRRSDSARRGTDG